MGEVQFGLVATQFGLVATQFGLASNQFGLVRGQLGLASGQFGLARGQFGLAKGQFGLAKGQFEWPQAIRLAAGQCFSFPQELDNDSCHRQLHLSSTVKISYFMEMLDKQLLPRLLFHILSKGVIWL